MGIFDRIPEDDMIEQMNIKESKNRKCNCSLIPDSSGFAWHSKGCPEESGTVHQFDGVTRQGMTNNVTPNACPVTPIRDVSSRDPLERIAQSLETIEKTLGLLLANIDLTVKRACSEPDRLGDRTRLTLANVKPYCAPLSPSEQGGLGGRTLVRNTSAPSDADKIPEWAAKWGIPTDHPSFAVFVDHWRGNGKPMKNWTSVWKNWLRREKQFAPKGAAPVQSSDYKLAWMKDK